jgi:hypothetical protein
MKILYLVLGAPAEGVKKKIRDKAAFLRKAQVETSVVIVQSDKDAFHKDDGDHRIRVDLSSVSNLTSLWFFWRLAILWEQHKIYRALSRFLEGKNFDIILMRYPISDYFLLAFMKKFGRRFAIVFEHNTLETDELKLRSSGSFWYRYFYFNEKWFGKKVRLKSAGMIGVTGEIAARQMHIVNNRTPAVVISNGIDVTRVKVKKQRHVKTRVNLLFLAGSRAPWHGVDILLNSLKKYKGVIQVHCYIAGDIEEDLVSEARMMPNVTLLESQSNDSLDALIEECDVGIGSLALFRNNMREACTLKVREYWARGLPFVIGYDDTDLIGNLSMNPFYRKIEVPQHEHFPSFDVNAVVSFASEVCSINGYANSMRALAEQYISYPAKANAYLNFFKSLRR